MSARTRKIKVTPSMRAALSYLSEETGQSVSALVRNAVDNYVKRDVLTTPREHEVVKVRAWIDDALWADAVQRSALEGVTVSEAVRAQLETLIGG